MVWALVGSHYSAGLLREDTFRGHFEVLGHIPEVCRDGPFVPSGNLCCAVYAGEGFARQLVNNRNWFITRPPLQNNLNLVSRWLPNQQSNVLAFLYDGAAVAENTYTNPAHNKTCSSDCVVSLVILQVLLCFNNAMVYSYSFRLND